MINSKYIKLNDSFKKLYKEAFSSYKPEKIFLFFKKYVKFIEDDFESYNRLFILDFPLLKDEDVVFNKEFNKNCFNYLKDITSDKIKVKKYYKGLGFSYIGLAYEYGLFNFDLDPYKSFNFYNISYKLNCSLGMFRLATCYERGFGTKKCLDKAICFYRCASKMGNPDAMHSYGVILINGLLNSEKDFNNGFNYLKLAVNSANKTFPYPVFDFGLYFCNNNDEDVFEDNNYAVNLFKKGSYLDDAKCQYKLGQIYQYGDLKEKKDLYKAIKYYLKSAENGNVNAQITISQYYLSGYSDLIVRDHKKSFYWILKAAASGEPEACFILAEYAETGTGIPKDPILGLFWFQISDRLGYKQAKIKAKELKKYIESENNGAEIPKSDCLSVFCCS